MQWRWAKDNWLSKGGVILVYDKAEHFLTYCLLTVAGLLLKLDHTGFILLILGVLWEIKDALLPYERAGFWGGDGFSWKDLVANGLGIGFGIWVTRMLGI